MKTVYVRKLNIDRASRFLRRYDACRREIEEKERLIALFDKNKVSQSAFQDLDAQSRDALYSYLAPSRAQVYQSLTDNYRLLERMTASLGRGIRQIREKRERDYLVFHYFYHFTHESIAEVLHYSERQIYRVACAARSSLSKTLKAPPMAKHIKFARFRVARKTPLCKPALPPLSLLAS